MSDSEPPSIFVAQLQQGEEGESAGESREEKPQSMERLPQDPSDTPGPDAELKATEESTANTEGARQVKIQSLFSQVRNQIRSQVGMDNHKKGILDVVNRVTRDRVKENGEQKPGQNEGNGEVEIEGEREGKKEDDGKSEAEQDSNAETVGDNTLEGGMAALRVELLASIETLRNELKEEMALLRAEAREHTDKAVKQLESKALTRGVQSINSSEKQLQPGSKSHERQKSYSVPSLVPARPRVLNRTMTTLNPKTCQPVVLGPRSKSETLGCPSENKDGMLLLESSDFHVFATQGNRYSRAGGNLLPACPPLRHNKKLVRGKVRLGNSTTK